MIKFEKVRWKNFLSTGNQFTEIELDRNETTLIIGENGAGKSTVLDALCFALFGKPFRTISKSQLINTVNAMETVVEIEFSIASRKYKVIRGIKPNKFEIWQNDKMLNQEANSRDYQKILEQQILKLNYRSFTQVVILGSSTFVPFMQLKAKFRREVVEDLLDIKIFSVMNLLLRQRLKDLATELQEVEYNYKLSSEKISMQETYIKDIKNNADVIIML
jgi:DNA repair exonuclease SbcCD ATPase subunit